MAKEISVTLTYPSIADAMRRLGMSRQKIEQLVIETAARKGYRPRYTKRPRATSARMR